MNRVDDRPEGTTGKRLSPLRRHEILHRLIYTIDHPDRHGELVNHTVQVDVSRDDGHAELYVDGRQLATMEMPAAFPVAGGVIEVASTPYGVRRVHLVMDNGTERRLDPLPGTLEHRRGRLHRRHPRLSRAIGWAAIAILVTSLVLAVPQAIELLTRLDRVEEWVGTFTSPIQLPAWLNASLTVAGVLAATERTLTLRRNRVLDIETLWTNL
ncbi:hypothetical protein [Actinophytocola sediminis]